MDISLEAGGVRIRNYNGNATFGSGYVFTPGGTNAGWHHLAIRVKPVTGTFADVEVLLDGANLPVTAQASAGTGQSLNTVDSPFGIGNTYIVDNGSQQGFTGWVDEFGGYGALLSDDEIAAMVAAGQPVTIHITQTVFDQPNSELDLMVEVSKLNVPYHVEAAAALSSGFTGLSGSIFTPTAAPWLLSVPVNLIANPNYYVRIAEGNAP
jgi:hypothetical protein